METTNINIPSFSEERIMIESLEANDKANAIAGTALLSSVYPQVNFVVGSYRKTNGEVTGDIITALNPESDLLYRERILSNIFNHTNNYSRLKSLILNQGDIANVLFDTHQAGHVNVWIKPKSTISNIRLNLIQTLVEENISIGIRPTVRLLQPRLLAFKVKVYHQLLDQTTVNDTREYINFYLDNLKYGESLVINSLTQYLRLKTETRIEVIIPEEEIILSEEGQCFGLNSLEVIYNV